MNTLTESTVSLSEGVDVFFQSRGLENAVSRSGKTSPILVLIHGYPESSHMFRYMVDMLPSHLPLFIPDIPGYGNSVIHESAISTSYSKRFAGAHILSALKQAVPSTTSKRDIILIGHDRGARIAHRLAVDNSNDSFNILGVVLMDIVPTIIQFASFAKPENAVGAYHWPFLAGPHPVPEEMIGAYGGGKWVDQKMRKWMGAYPQGVKRLEENLPVYMKHFEKQSVINASCADYRAGATVDCEEQVEDQKAGRKIQVPVLVLFSERYLGSRYDMPTVWRDWVNDKSLLELKGIGNSVGHFLPEEDPETVTTSVVGWLRAAMGIAL